MLFAPRYAIKCDVQRAILLICGAKLYLRGPGLLFSVLPGPSPLPYGFSRGPIPSGFASRHPACAAPRRPRGRIFEPPVCPSRGGGGGGPRSRRRAATTPATAAAAATTPATTAAAAAAPATAAQSPAAASSAAFATAVQLSVHQRSLSVLAGSGGIFRPRLGVRLQGGLVGRSVQRIAGLCFDRPGVQQGCHAELYGEQPERVWNKQRQLQLTSGEHCS